MFALGVFCQDALGMDSCVYMYLDQQRCCAAGVLFRAYPEPWQVLCRRGDKLQLVHTQDTMPELKHVALNILPQA